MSEEGEEDSLRQPPTQVDPTRVQTSFPIPSWVYTKGAETLGDQYAKEKAYPLKRPFDLFLAIVGLMIASPLWLVFSVAIKLGDRGPILFVQDRWGKDKTKFQAYKFRSMVPNAVERFGHVQAMEHDPRVTKIGRLLRATSLDEMPQLLNIAKGDMSWVGPRALPIDEIQVQEEGDLPDESIPGFRGQGKAPPWTYRYNPDLRP